jgi:predicted N-formylglutamate amidohydrolase
VSHDGDAQQPTFVLLTCEHGGNEVPAAYKQLFRGHGAVLESHRGYDIGALGVALHMASRLSAPIIFSTVTRLLVDLNRSLDQPDVFSEFTADLSEGERRRVVDTFYRPHRASVARTIACAVGSGSRVLHLGVHSCTDVLHGERRELDIALLFDETRTHEAGFAHRYRDAMTSLAESLRCPFNEPYRGSDDGLTTTLRSAYPQESYLGIEIEVRQGMIIGEAEQRTTGDLLAAALGGLAPMDAQP